MKKHSWIQFASIGFCLSIALAFAYAPAASAQQDSDHPPSDNPQCTDENLQGRYGYIVSGWLVSLPPVALAPIASVGIVTFDGEGILNAQDTFNNNGVITRRMQGVGTYTVNSNCTGSATVAGDFEGFTFDFMIVPGTGGSEFSLIVTNSGTVETGAAIGTVATGDAQRIPDEECTDATVQGTYRLHAHGFATAPGNAPSASVGIRIVDGAGNLSGQDTVSTNGNITPRTVLSTYMVNSNCTGTQAFTTPDLRTFDWVIVAGGAHVFFIRTNPGAINSGTYKKQSRSCPTPDNDCSAGDHSDRD